ncbi:hypothetical protein SDRG_13474 [Saprolegnia diclina VS20]|uniref:ELMO domain-containing protein n=1 Tax=Saprolegnia diclina (strain VS20) TaxID=1156394 RepID=T0RGG5_SAPDV|nr:hypothetical protein SDRG_13474 [Saprolegnia diclina VS20]EQC28792.1 hypothetical protein SDRG_13474 [Saprolegnia diclina VS20]|eukprot:XP_008617787.1 hypothetical protein SDRG_13474 [Saprolegnia diclina VS20]
MADDASDARPPPGPIAVAALRIDTQAVEAESLEAPLAVSPTYGVARNQVDPAVLAALPKEIQDEVLASFSVPASLEPAPADLSDAAWTCPMCTFLNHAALVSCEMCEFSVAHLMDADDEQPSSPHLLSETLLHAAKSVVQKSLTAIKTTHEHRDELLQSATAKMHHVHSTASKQLHHVYEATSKQLHATLSPRSAKFFTKKGSLHLPSPNVLLELDVLRTDLKTHCTPSETVYEALLQELWTTVFSQSAIPGMDHTPFTRDGDGWLQLGFQRSNPDTDFRGGGLLGLKCLVYVCHMHMDKMAYIFADQVPNAGQRWYPVCVAGINLTCMLAGLLKLGDGSFAETSDNCWRLFEEPSAFYELYFYAFLKMDQIWHRSQATFMQFGDVLKATKKLVRYALAQGPTSLAEVTAFTESIHVDDFKITRREEYYDDVDDGECPDPHRITEDDRMPVATTLDIASLQYELHK